MLEIKTYIEKSSSLYWYKRSPLYKILHFEGYPAFKFYLAISFGISTTSCSIGFNPSIFIALCKSYEFKNFNLKIQITELINLDFGIYILSVVFIMSFFSILKEIFFHVRMWRKYPQKYDIWFHESMIISKWKSRLNVNRRMNFIPLFPWTSSDLAPLFYTFFTTLSVNHGGVQRLVSVSDLNTDKYRQDNIYGFVILIFQDFRELRAPLSYYSFSH